MHDNIFIKCKNINHSIINFSIKLFLIFLRTHICFFFKLKKLKSTKRVRKTNECTQS